MTKDKTDLDNLDDLSEQTQVAITTQRERTAGNPNIHKHVGITKLPKWRRQLIQSLRRRKGKRDV